ncbi:MAG TPA: amidohydrolase family protein [Candidatus Babeliales bacterium]|nr:amidohydrolase family protein [Candidatus Babeliales bacterium]
MALAPANVIVIGGTIHTVDDRYSSAKAFAIAGNRFSYVGSVAGAMEMRGPATEVLELEGATVMPGLVDAHLHLTGLGLALEQADLRDVHSFEELVARAERHARTSNGGWVFGRGWDESLWPDRDLPVHDELSAAIPDRPVVLTRVDGHALLANACAMRDAGIREDMPTPPGGRIVRAGDGRLTGVFIDTAQELIFDRAPKPSQARLVQAIRAAIAECNRWGVTAIAEPGCDDAALAAHRELLERDEFSIRNYAMLHDQPELIASHTGRGPVEAAYDGRLWVNAIKMYADGALGSRGAALLAPYSDDPANLGLTLASPKRIEDTTVAALRNGFQVCVHAIGDRANRGALDAYEAALRRARVTSEPRLRIEHAQVVAAQDVRRFAELGIIASMQSTHALSDAPWVESRLGPERAGDAYAWRSLLDAGATIANGSDAPVEAVNTARSFYAAVARPWQPHQRMTRRETLDSMTLAAARANFADHLIGSITPGKYADFVVMDRDWMAVAPEAILETTILRTYFAGQPVYGFRARN